jgi:hypothetical protein
LLDGELLVEAEGQVQGQLLLRLGLTLRNRRREVVVLGRVLFVPFLREYYFLRQQEIVSIEGFEEELYSVSVVARRRLVERYRGQLKLSKLSGQF